MGQKHQRRKEHGDRHGGDKWLNRLCRQDTIGLGILKQDKSKFATLRQGDREKRTLSLCHPEDEAKTEKDQPFDQYETSGETCD